MKMKLTTFSQFSLCHTWVCPLPPFQQNAVFLNDCFDNSELRAALKVGRHWAQAAPEGMSQILLMQRSARAGCRWRWTGTVDVPEGSQVLWGGEVWVVDWALAFQGM